MTTTSAAPETIIRETLMPDGRRILTAWEREQGGSHSHGTITTFGRIWYGSVATRRIPPELDALPALSEERSIAVRAHYDALREEAYALILAARPDAELGERCRGEIELPPLDAQDARPRVA